MAKKKKESIFKSQSALAEPSRQRRYFRREIETPVSFTYDGETRECLSTTLGAGGMYIQSVLPPPVGSRIAVRFSLPDAPEQVSAVAKVVHCLPNAVGELPPGFGIQFLEISERDRLRIATFVENEIR